MISVRVRFGLGFGLGLGLGARVRVLVRDRVGLWFFGSVRVLRVRVDGVWVRVRV